MTEREHNAHARGVILSINLFSQHVQIQHWRRNHTPPLGGRTPLTPARRPHSSPVNEKSVQPTWLQP